MTRLDDLLTQSHSIRANLISAERKLRDSLAAVIEMQAQLRTADVALLLAIQIEQEPRREETPIEQRERVGREAALTALEEGDRDPQ